MHHLARKLHIVTQQVCIGFCMLALYTAPHVLFADTNVSLTPLALEVKEGEPVLITVVVHPQTTSNYTAVVEFEYPPEMLYAEDFFFSDTWVPLYREEYNQIDAIQGRIVKAAGYPGGITEATRFGTLRFQALRSGRATVTLTSASMALDSEGNNVLTSSPIQTSVAIAARDTQEGLPTALTGESEMPDRIPLSYRFTRDVGSGDRNLDVAYLQLCLRDEAFYTQEVTGVFDQETEQAVRAFQEQYRDTILVPNNLTQGTGVVAVATRVQLNTTCFQDQEARNPLAREVPEQLFDIALSLDEPTIASAKELIARLTFENFGQEPTPVDVTFVVLDATGEEVYRDEGTREDITVETEAVLTKTFDDLALYSGTYTLLVQTRYDVDVVDEFTVAFTVTPLGETARVIPISTPHSTLLLLILLIVVSLGSIFFLLQQIKTP